MERPPRITRPIYVGWLALGAALAGSALIWALLYLVVAAARVEIPGLSFPKDTAGWASATWLSVVLFGLALWGLLERLLHGPEIELARSGLRPLHSPWVPPLAMLAGFLILKWLNA
jgi:hypothetical protein